MNNSSDVFLLEQLLISAYYNATTPSTPAAPPGTPSVTPPSTTAVRPTYEAMTRSLENLTTTLVAHHGQIPQLSDLQDPRTQILIVKSVCLSLLWISAFALCCLPLCVSKCLSRSHWWKDNERRILGALNYSSGGVFLSTIFLDLLPDLDASYQKAFKANGILINYPFPELTVVCGMFMFIFMEQFIMTCSKRCFGTDDVIDMVLEEGQGHSHSVACGDHTHHVKCSYEDSRYEDLVSDGASESLLGDDDTSTITTRRSSLTNRLTKCNSQNTEDDFNDSGCYHSSSTEVVGRPPPKPFRRMSRETMTSSRTATILRSFSLMFALSLHSVFEGLVLGFQTDQATVWKLFFALVIHKSLVAFSLGSKFATVIGVVSMRSIIGMTFIFSLGAPAGGVVSTAIGEGYQTDDSPSFQLIVSLSSGVASGSFLFVTFFEILRSDGSHIGFVNACFMTLGFVVAAVV